VHVNTGDKVYQKAYWDAWRRECGGGEVCEGIRRRSRVERRPEIVQRGHDTSNVTANTTADQTNILSAT